MMFDDDDLEQDRIEWYEARVSQLEAELASLKDYFDNDENSEAWRTLQARIRELEAQLRAIDIACKSVADENTQLKAALRHLHDSFHKQPCICWIADLLRDSAAETEGK
jgi:septal ring factor EnvC (AmiA/AmiB activator)